jgi:hypothetical protein
MTDWASALPGGNFITKVKDAIPVEANIPVDCFH